MQKKKIIFAAFIPLIIVALILSFSFTGCKATTTETTVAETTVAETAAAETTAAEPVELIFWMPVAQDDPHIPLFQEIDKHMKEKFNISVKFEGQSMDAWFELLTTAGISQAGPDLLFNWSGVAYGIDAGKNHLYEPLNDILPDGMFDKIAGWGGITDSDGNIYGVPYDIAIAGLAYNKDMFTKAGIEFSDFPRLWYWDEFIEICQKLKDAGYTPLGFANKEGYYGEWWLGYPTASYFNSDEEISNYYQKESVNSEPFLDALAKYKYLYDQGYFLKEGLTLDHTNNTQQQFIGEKVAMQFTEAMYTKTYVDSLGAEKVGANFWVYLSNEGENSKKVTGIYNHVIGITPWSEYKEESIKVLEELCATDWGANVIKQILGFTPSYKNWKPEAPDPNNPWSFVEGKAIEIIAQNGGSGDVASSYIQQFAQTIYQFNNLFLTGDITAEEFAKELDAARNIQ